MCLSHLIGIGVVGLSEDNMNRNILTKVELKKVHFTLIKSNRLKFIQFVLPVSFSPPNTINTNSLIYYFPVAFSLVKIFREMSMNDFCLTFLFLKKFICEHL